MDGWQNPELGNVVFLFIYKIILKRQQYSLTKKSGFTKSYIISYLLSIIETLFV